MLQWSIVAFLILGYSSLQAFGLKKPVQSKVSASSPPQASVQRVCECVELNRCYDELIKKEHDMLVTCREQCGSQIFLKTTSDKIVQCYNQYANARLEADSRRSKCVEEMGSGDCLSTKSNPQPHTFVINTTEFFHSGSKRYQRKLPLPDSVNSLNACIKTCTKNQGTVHFNADGTIVKKQKAEKKKGNNAKHQHKTVKARSICSGQLGCELAVVDKKLEKHAKHLCSLQPGPHDDHESALCFCLEEALGQNLRCFGKSSKTDTCSSTESACSEKRKQ